jgi:hypothetical protein
MTLFAELVGGPADGEAVRIASGTQVIEVDLGPGGVAWYSSTGAWVWQYKGVKRLPAAGDPGPPMLITTSTYAQKI